MDNKNNYELFEEQNPSLSVWTVSEPEGNGQTESVYRNSLEGREVFIMYSENGEALCALKRFSVTHSRGYQETLKLAQTEHDVMQRFDHPNILRCLKFQANSEQNYCDLMLEYGEATLTKCLPRMDNSQKRLALQQICSGLEHIHQQGFVHADIKCDNVLLVNGVWKIADFGTTTGKRIFQGTVHYMAPEVVRNEACSKASDVWSFGALVYHTAHGYPPFSGLEQQRIIYRIGSQSTMDTVDESIPGLFKTIIFHCTQKDPSSRPTATDLRQLLSSM